MNKTPNKNKGFTLVEIIVAAALGSMSVYAVTQSSVNFLVGYCSLTAQSTQSMQTNRIIKNIGYDIRMASSISIEQDQRLTVTTVDDDSYTYYTATIENVPKLFKRDNLEDTVSTLADYVTDFTITHPDGDTSAVQVEVTFDQKILGNIASKGTLSTRYAKRN